MRETVTRIVVVDDEEDVVTLLRFQLNNVPGISVVGSAADGRSGIDTCRELQPDAVVMDLLMPGVNGFQAIAELKEEMPHIGVVAYTAVAGQFVRNEMSRLDVPLVLKSGDVAPLVEAIRGAVGDVD